MPHPVELGMMWTTAILPVWIVLRARRLWVGYLVGVLVFWALLVQAGQWNIELDPTYDSGAPMICLAVGWLFGGIYCGFWVGVRLLARLVLSRRARRSSVP
mgnify:CR=1 FL=1